MKRFHAFAAALLLVAGPVHGISSIQVDTFGDGTTMNWRDESSSSPIPPVAVPRGDGDYYLRIESTGQSGAGSRMVVVNTEQWNGDWHAAGVTSISMGVANQGSTDLYLRIGVERSGLPPSRWVSTYAGALPPPECPECFVALGFELTEGLMTSVSGSMTLEEVLSDVTQLRIFSSEAAAWEGDAIPAVLGVDDIASYILTDVGSMPPRMTRVQLLPSTPNPFNPTTTIRYVLPVAGHVEVTIHDAHGRLVERLLSAHQGAGAQAVRWDGGLRTGRLASSGTYVVRVETGQASVAGKITLLK